MIYRLLEWIAGIMLHWFYSEIRIEGNSNIPERGPMLVAVNHPNALVDSLVAGWVVPRRLRFTAKATLMSNPIIALVFRMVGVVPLRRAGDQTGSAREDALRNRAAFQEIIGVLRAGGSVLIFPEGKSNGEGLQPLRTGLARIALEAKHNGVADLNILPIGLNFEDKGSPSSRVVARVGESIRMDTWQGDHRGS
jgi:1-acyl-sn-glycerol-3-phosphate acyltransferase